MYCVRTPVYGYMIPQFVQASVCIHCILLGSICLLPVQSDKVLTIRLLYFVLQSLVRIVRDTLDLHIHSIRIAKLAIQK